MPFDPIESTVATIHAALVARQTTCREITSAFLTRIQIFERYLHSIITLDPHNALATADALDRSLLVHLDSTSNSIDKQTSINKLPSPLFGIPILLKDNQNTYDMPTTSGSLAFATFQPTHDSAMVHTLRNAGAIILGKANMHELALEGLSISSLRGQTRNPYDLTRTPGGSSGGSAVAVAASLCVLATGTDTMNSLRSPASATCLCSIRPTAGLITRDGVVPVSRTQDAVGVIARCVRDVAVAFDVLASGGGEDLSQSVHAEERLDAAFGESEGNVDYIADIETGVLHGLRIGLVEGFINRVASAETTPVNACIDETVQVLTSRGATVIPITDNVYDASALHAALDTQRYEFREAMDDYLKCTPTTGTRLNSLEELYRGTDYLVVPSQYHQIRNSLSSSMQDAQYDKIRTGIRELKQELRHTFMQHRLDVLVYPQQKNLVVKLGSPTQSGRNGILAALTGSPVVTIPVGFSPASTDAPCGVPVGMEILGKPYSERSLLQIAYQLEQCMKVRVPPELSVERLTANDEAIDLLMKAAYPIGTLGEVIAQK